MVSKIAKFERYFTLLALLCYDEVCTYGEPSPGIASVVGRSQRPVQPDLPLIAQVIEKSIKVLLLAEEVMDPEPLGGTVPVAIVSGAEWEAGGTPIRTQHVFAQPKL